MAVPWAPRSIAVVVDLSRLSRREALGGLALVVLWAPVSCVAGAFSVGNRMRYAGHGRSSEVPALRRASRTPRALGDPQLGWRLGLFQWASGAGDPLGANLYESVACLVLKLCPTKISR